MSGADISILYRDDYLVAVNKPAGLLVHRSAVDPREKRFAVQLVRDILRRHVYPVHRLDRPTSGVLLFALSPDVARLLAASLATGVMDKEYLAVVRGYPVEVGVIDHPLAQVADRRLPQSSSGAGEREALTRYRRLATVELPCTVGRYATSRYALVVASPVTGRRHQIRRHFKHLFHPVIGDTRYGEGRHNRFFREELGCARLLLHARLLLLAHPATGAPVAITAPLDADFSLLLERFGWRDAVPPVE